MLVVSDASPLNILIRIEQAHVLGLLFHAVVVPASVAEEMSRAATPPSVRNWIAQPPPWLSIRIPALAEKQASSRHQGERDAIMLAQELEADAILLDEGKPRQQASKMGLRVVGTVGILEQAADGGFIPDLEAIHNRLRRTDFYIRSEILESSLARHRSCVHRRPGG